MFQRTIQIRPFRPDDSAAFREINEAWIREYFHLEEADREVLNDPEGHVLEPGGRIFIACEQNKPIGCCALIPIAPGEFEVAKMAVCEEYRGRGLGRKLLEHTIAQAREIGARSLYLETNARLAPAIHLYESVGFRHLPPEQVTPSPYARANIYMDLKL